MLDYAVMPYWLIPIVLCLLCALIDIFLQSPDWLKWTFIAIYSFTFYYFLVYGLLALFSFSQTKKMILAGILPVVFLLGMLAVPKKLKMDPTGLGFIKVDFPFAIGWAAPGILISRQIDSAQYHLKAVKALDPFAHDLRTLAQEENSYSILPLAIGVQADGKILVLTEVRGYRQGLKLTRFNRDGTLDLTFGLTQGCVQNRPADRLLIDGQDNILLYNHLSVETGLPDPLQILGKNGDRVIKTISLPSKKRLLALKFSALGQWVGLLEDKEQANEKNGKNYKLVSFPEGRTQDFQLLLSLTPLLSSGNFLVHDFHIISKNELLLMLTAFRPDKGYGKRYVGRINLITQKLSLVENLAGDWGDERLVLPDGSILIATEGEGAVIKIFPDGMVDTIFDQHFKVLGPFNQRVSLCLLKNGNMALAGQFLNSSKGPGSKPWGRFFMAVIRDNGKRDPSFTLR